MRHESCQVDVVGDPFLSCQYAAAAYSFSPSINISRAVSRGDIHILDHVCSLCLGYGMPISRHAQTLDVQNPHDRLRGAARPIPSLQVIQSMYRQHSNHDPFGVSPVLAAPIFPAHHQQSPAVDYPWLYTADPCRCRIPLPAPDNCLDGPRILRYCFRMRLFTILQRCQDRSPPSFLAKAEMLRTCRSSGLFTNTCITPLLSSPLDLSQLFPTLSFGSV